jgi:hypothetical protein
MGIRLEQNEAGILQQSELRLERLRIEGGKIFSGQPFGRTVKGYEYIAPCAPASGKDYTFPYSGCDVAVP